MQLGKERHPKHVGQYEILEEIDRGGMGVVYRARQKSPERAVALKMIKLGGFASDEARLRFVNEVEFLARLEHPNIVRIYDAGGLSEGEIFYTMPLIQGGNVAKQRDRFAEPRRAARLLATVARAVQFCHDAKPDPVLHRDLKPENILLGPDDHPYLSDFGIAKALDKADPTRSVVMGTVQYMAPEILSGGTADKLSEVYSLGAILYELLAGHLPFGTGTAVEVVRRIENDELRPIRRPRDDMQRRLEQVCRVALDKDPKRRYQSAAAFADDLERVLRDETPEPPAQGAVQRIFRWLSRHPLLSVGATGITLLCAAIVGVALQLLSEQEAALVKSAQQINVFAARAQAGAVLNELRQYAEHVEQAAANIELERDASLSECAPAAGDLSRYAAIFDAVTLFSTAGVVCRRWPPPPPPVIGRSFAFREYFQGASTLAGRGERAAYVGPAILSESDLTFQFALSAPVFSPPKLFRGVLLAMLGTDSVFGPVTIDDDENSGRFTALLAPRGRERSDQAPRSGQYVLLVHSKLKHGAGVALPARYATLLSRRFQSGKPAGHQLEDASLSPLSLDHYQDPLPGFEGRWLAAFAPVGSTGYVVLVQSRYDDAARASRVLRRLAARVGLGALLTLICLLILTLRLNRTRLRRL